MNSAAVTRWYREPWAWFVFALPLSAVIAGLSTVWIAASGRDAPVHERVRRTAQVQQLDAGADQRAAELGLAARITLSAETGAVELALAGTLSAPEQPVRMTLVHPTLAEHDRTTLLTPLGKGRHAGRIERVADMDYRVDLEAADGSWVLRGPLPQGADETGFGARQP